MCYLRSTHPSPQKRWADETEPFFHQEDEICSVPFRNHWNGLCGLHQASQAMSPALPLPRSVGNSLRLKSTFPPPLGFFVQMLQSGHCCQRTEPEFLLCLPLPCPEVFCSIAACSSTVLQLCPCCSHRMAHAACEGCGTPLESGKAITNKRDLLTTNPSGFSQFPDLDYKLPGSNLATMLGKEESKEIASGNGLRKLQNLKGFRQQNL